MKSYAIELTETQINVLHTGIGAGLAALERSYPEISKLLFALSADIQYQCVKDGPTIFGTVFVGAQSLIEHVKLLKVLESICETDPGSNHGPDRDAVCEAIEKGRELLSQLKAKP